ncbi:MAG TPA: acylphosphatase [Verrucomicrobiota bacterium]|nr:acylphosphatase [Verrucomicrobiota bacterium]HNT14525.1 acylphosphatase [Verrucomicrobiota bacterium]
MQILYSGHVQGVGFRYTVQTLAAGYAVTGSVRNLPDGRVELTAEGTPEELEAFRAAVRTGGLGANIRQEEAQWTPARGGLAGFAIER